MPGFGGDPFGRWAFGESAWAYRTLWGSIPQEYRTRDTNGLLQAFVEGLYPLFDKPKRLARSFPELRDPLKVRTQYSEQRRLKLGRVIVPQGATTQSGSDGKVDALFHFVAASGRFRESDLGKELTVSRSLVPGNNRTALVISIIDLHTVATEPMLAADAGPLRWELQEKVDPPANKITVEVAAGAVQDVNPGWLLNDGLADFEVLARRLFKQQGSLAYRTEREGTDGDIDNTLRFAAASANITPRDVGKLLSISGSSTTANNRSFEIRSVDLTTPSPRILLGGFVAQDAGPLQWAILPRAELDLQGTAYPAGVVEQFGADLALVGGGSFDVTSASAVFTSADEGKRLDISGSLLGQDGQVEIVTVLTSTSATTDTSFASAESGLYWELRTATETGVVERSGADAAIIEEDSPSPGQHVVQIASAGFDPSEVGYTLTFRGSAIPGNNITVSVDDVLDDQTVVVAGALVLDVGPLIWELSSADATKVEARAESLLKFMAPDFGLEIDTQESEARQRSLIAHANAWLDLKGHESGYEALGALSGFNVDAFPVWRVSFVLAASLPPSSIYEIADEDTGGRADVNGSITSTNAFFSPTAQFRASDVGKNLQLSNSDDPANDGTYLIDVYVDPNTVRISGTFPGATPDYGIGGALFTPTLVWVVTRYYTNLAPMRPRFDEISEDVLAYWIANNPPPGDEFHIDQYCWETNFAAFVDVAINSVTNVAGLLWEVDITGQADVIPRDPLGGPAQPLPGATWKLVDGSAAEFIVETAPDGTGPYQIRVLADPSALPALGPARLEYICRETPSCDYCKASVIVAEISEGSIADESGVAVERVLERLIVRLEEWARPHHVRLVPIIL